MLHQGDDVYFSGNTALTGKIISGPNTYGLYEVQTNFGGATQWAPEDQLFLRSTAAGNLSGTDLWIQNYYAQGWPGTAGSPIPIPKPGAVMPNPQPGSNDPNYYDDVIYKNDYQISQAQPASGYTYNSPAPQSPAESIWYDGAGQYQDDDGSVYYIEKVG